MAAPEVDGGGDCDTVTVVVPAADGAADDEATAVKSAVVVGAVDREPLRVAPLEASPLADAVAVSDREAGCVPIVGTGEEEPAALAALSPLGDDKPDAEGEPLALDDDASELSAVADGV